MRLPTRVPVTPDRDEAREWLARELARPEYREAQGSWLQQLWDRVREAFDTISVPGLGTNWTGVVVVLALLAIVVVAVLLVAGPLQRSVRADGGDAVFVSGPQSSAEHLTRADAAATAGDFETAVQERFRALVRSLEERALIDRRPGRTAYEVALEASGPLPQCAAGLIRAARTFDDVRYGGRGADAGTDELLRRVLSEVAGTRPAPFRAAASA
ncbi:MAG: DUF4129 domain-containing protein [Janthinobacterium lividum]